MPSAVLPPTMGFRPMTVAALLAGGGGGGECSAGKVGGPAVVGRADAVAVGGGPQVDQERGGGLDLVGGDDAAAGAAVLGKGVHVGAGAGEVEAGDLLGAAGAGERGELLVDPGAAHAGAGDQLPDVHPARPGRLKRLPQGQGRGWAGWADRA